MRFDFIWEETKSSNCNFQFHADHGCDVFARFLNFRKPLHTGPELEHLIASRIALMKPVERAIEIIEARFSELLDNFWIIVAKGHDKTLVGVLVGEQHLVRKFFHVIFPSSRYRDENSYYHDCCKQNLAALPCALFVFGRWRGLIFDHEYVLVSHGNPGWNFTTAITQANMLQGYYEKRICWSGRRESNPHQQLGRLQLYH